MNDDHSSRGTGGGSGDWRKDLPAPKNRGLFRSRTDLPDPPGARLRVVTASGLASRSPRQPADIWDDLRQVALGKESLLIRETTAGSGDPVTASFDTLRTRLLKILHSNGLHRVAIVSPTRGCGATFSAVRLAQSLARVPGSRTVLLDLNQRRPGIAAALDMPGIGDMRGFLTGQVLPQDHIVRAGPTLAVGLAQDADPEAGHLLHGDICALAVGDLMDRLSPDVLLCDLPPLLEHDDLLAFLPQVDGVLLVADATTTSPDHIAACEKALVGETRVLGVILNQVRRAGPVPVEA